MKSFSISQLTVMTTGLLLLCLGSSGLELNPSVTPVVLSINSSFSITCSGGSDVTWRFKREENVPEFHTENQSPSSSVLRLEQVTWRHTGVYVCSENGTNETREAAVFVPDPEVWFLENDHVMVTKTRVEGTIPCLAGGVEILTDIPSSMSMQSSLSITKVSLAGSGQYVCQVNEVVHDQKASASINITVLEKGFVALSSDLDRSVSAQLGENVELKVEIQAYPKPTVHWTKDGTAITGHNTIQENETRFVSTLTLVRIRLEQMGLYTVSVQNDDDFKDLTFEVKVETV